MDVVDFELPMSIGLYNYQGEDNIECIFNCYPSVKQWWITAFNPEDKSTRSEDMVVVGKIDFKEKVNLINGVYKALNNDKN